MSIVSIQIPSYNSTDELDCVLNSLLTSDFDKARHQYEITICHEGYDLENKDFEYLLQFPTLWGIDDRVKFIPSGGTLKVDGITSFANIRCEIQELVCSGIGGFCTTPDYVMMADDDFKFGQNSFKKYDQAVDYLDIHPDCGMVQCAGFLGGYLWAEAIRSRMYGIFWTDRGLIFRTRAGIYFPPHYSELLGLGEEHLVCLSWIVRGYYLARQLNNPTLHRARYLTLGPMRPDGGELSSDYPISYDSDRMRSMDDTCINRICGIIEDWTYSHGDEGLVGWWPEALGWKYEAASLDLGFDPLEDRHDLIQPDSVTHVNKRVVDYYKSVGLPHDRFTYDY